MNSPKTEKTLTMVVLPFVLSTLVFPIWAVPNQDDAPRSQTGPSSRAAEMRDEPAGSAEVTKDLLEVYDQPDEASYLTGMLARGQRIRVRMALDGGWLSIDPPATSVYWIERSAISPREGPGGVDSDVVESEGSSEGRPARARAVCRRAVVRSGNPRARLPGPPRGFLAEGTTVQLLDRPPVKFGRGAGATVWLPIEPPAGQTCYVRASGTRALSHPSPRSPEIQTAYDGARERSSAAGISRARALPEETAAEIASVEAMHRAILRDQPIENWRFEGVRARYQALLKRAGNDPAVEEAIRVRLARVTRHEQAAQAARTIQATLAESHRRDGLVAEVERGLGQAGRAGPRSYNAVGFVKPSSRMVDGRRLYSLIGASGSPIAYLDIPPGLDIEPLLAHRVGIRGVTHYNEDLSARLITVREMESIESRR